MPGRADAPSSLGRSSTTASPFSGDVDNRLSYWQNLADGDDRVRVGLVTDKELGVYAKTDIPRNTVVACWKMRVYEQQGRENSNYAVALGNRPYVADVDESVCLKAPRGEPAGVGFLLNEPAIGKKPNCRNFFASGDHTTYVAGDVVTMELHTTRAVAKGDELTWDYGPDFLRDYPSRYTKQRTSPRWVSVQQANTLSQS